MQRLPNHSQKLPQPQFRRRGKAVQLLLQLQQQQMVTHHPLTQRHLVVPNERINRTLRGPSLNRKQRILTCKLQGTHRQASELYQTWGMQWLSKLLLELLQLWQAFLAHQPLYQLNVQLQRQTAVSLWNLHQRMVPILLCKGPLGVLRMERRNDLERYVFFLDLSGHRQQP